MLISKHIITQCKQGSQAAFAQCYKALAPYVYPIIRTYIFDGNSHKDVMQEVFVQIFSSINRYDDSRASFKTWTTKITINCCLSYIKKRSRRLNYLALEDYEIGEGKHSVEELNLSHLDREDLYQLLSDMPDGFRTVFTLFILDDYQHKEIANVLSISESTSRSQLNRAIAWLKKHHTYHQLSEYYEK